MFKENKESLQKKASERYHEVFPKNRKNKNNNVGVKNIKISLKMKNKGWLSIEKIIIK